jgi:UDP-glucose 4-epimerase
MKILVTGGAGFIGSHLVDLLLTQKHEVIVVDNLANGNLKNLEIAKKHKHFSFHKLDILNVEELGRITTKIDVVFHLACLGVRHSLHSPIENQRVNAEGTLNVLQLALKCNVDKLYYISSSEVYGKTLSFPIDESSLTNPTTIYGAGKLAGEHYTQAIYQTNGLDYLIIRLFNNYGPRAHFEGDSGELIPRSIVKIISGENPIIFGEGNYTRDFLYVQDAVRIISLFMQDNSIKNTTVNVGVGEETTIKTIIKELISHFPDKHVNINYLDERPADVPRLWVNNSKMIQLIGNQNFLQLKDGLSKTIDYYMNLDLNNESLRNLSDKNWVQ